MLDMIRKIIKYPRITSRYPKTPIDTTFLIGQPSIDNSICNKCGVCVNRCPVSAIVIADDGKKIGINIDECIFCGLCEEICPCQAATMTKKIELAVKDRSALRTTPIIIEECHYSDQSFEVICEKVEKKINKIFGRSLQIREIDAGSCNGCDYEINALNNPLNDLERLGIHFVASPRHADMLLVTGTATRNMELALITTYNATPDPKLVVAIGACACSGGIFRDNYATKNGIDCIIPVDVYVPGCPPRPQAIIYGILMALDRV